MSHPSRQAKSLSQKSMAETDEDQQTQRKIIELNESEEGQITSSSNYIFQQIGFPLRLNPNPSNFDLDNPPTHALAISHNPQSLLFLAHSKGFYVAKTAEVVARAKLAKEEDNKGYCIQELCVVDVQIGEIRSLAVSKDSSTLAVCVGAKVEFYSVESLLNKEREPFYSCGIEDSIYVKDFRWRKKLENSFLVLGSDGRLYYGDLDSPLKVVMGNVDAVDWSTEGNFIIVAEQDSLSIFSSSFKEQYTLSMPFNSTDTDSEGTIKVDSINWIRKDCVILGCFQITGDGEENGYLIQVVSCKEGDISEGSSELVLISFNEAFVGIDDDTIPFGCGPHLFLSYLEHGKIALVANKKSTEEHIQLFSWSLDAKQTEVVQVYQSQDEAYLPRIHYQENEDDNMIMGFGVDATSLCEKVHVTLGVERKELSPYCILLCLTLDEKILMFYVADATESADSRKIGTPFSDETEKPSAAITLACDNSGTSSQFEEHNAKEKGSYAQQLKMSQDEVETNEGGLVLKGHALQTPDLNDNLKNASPSPQPLASKRESSILACDNSGTSSQFEEHNAKEKGSYAQHLKMSQDEVETNEGGLVLKGHALQTPDLNDNLKNASPSPQPLASKRESSILACDNSGTSSQFEEHNAKEKGSYAQQLKMSQDEVETNEGGLVLKGHALQTPDLNDNLKNASPSPQPLASKRESSILACDNSGTSSQFEEHNAKEKGSYAQQLKMSQDEVETNEGGLVLKGHALQTPDLNDNLKNASPSPQPLASKRESSILACDNSGTSSQFEEHNAKEKGSYAQQLKMSQDEVETNEGGLVLKGHALQTPDLNDNLKNASPSPQPLASKRESSILACDNSGTSSQFEEHNAKEKGSYAQQLKMSQDEVETNEGGLVLKGHALHTPDLNDNLKNASPSPQPLASKRESSILACDNSGTSSQFEEHNAKEKGSYAQQLKMSQDEVETNEGGLVLKGHALQTPDLNDNLKNASPSPQPLASKRESSILACDNSGTSSQFEEHNAKEKGSYAQQLKMSQDEVETNEGGLVLKGHALQTPDLNDNLKNASPSPQPLASKTESSILDKSTVAVGSNSLCKDSILLQKPVVPSSGVLGTSTGSMSSIFQSKNKDSLGSDLVSNSFSRNSQALDSGSNSLSKDTINLQKPSGVLGTSTGSTPSIFQSKNKDSLGSDLVSNSFSRNSQALDFGSNSLSKDTINLQKPSGVLGTSTGSTPSIFQSKNKDSLGSDEASNAFSRNSQAPAFGFNSLSKDPINLQKPSADLGTSTGSAPSNFHSKIKDPLVSDEASNLFSRNLQRDGVQSASSGSHSSHKLLSSNESNSRLTSTTDNRVEQSGSRVQNTALDTGNQSLSDLRFSSILNTREPNSVPQFSTNVSGKSAPIGGQHSSARVAKFGSESGMRISQVSPYGGSSSQNPLESRLQPPDEKVNEMAKELDVLLSGIEREGGFRDACIIFQEDSVLGIEQDLDYLAKRCRVLKSMTEERFDGVQNLLDQTVQVLARKIYIEGIVKQASDSQYWDLWDRQKLTPELELKRKQILKFNQNLTNQLIELERHFNTLELNKFGENCEVHTTRRVLQSSSKSSRDGQAFHKLYNTMNSQLAAAEQLSQCLTKQMAVLNIEPASAKRKSVTKELFESIGLSYDGDSFRSPNVKKAIQSPESIKKLPFSSARGAIKDQSRRSPSSVVKSFESETARRRVSLDRSWATFTPPKTTVKRMLLQEEQPQMNANKSSLVANKEGGKQFSPVAHLRDHKNYSVPSHFYVRKEGATTSQLHAERDNEDKATKQVPFKWTKDLSGNFQSATMKPPVLQANQRSNLVSSSSGVDTMSSPRGTQKITNEISERPAIGQTLVNKFDQSSVQPISYSNATPIFPSESSVNRTSVTTNLTPAQTLSSSNRTSQMPASMLSLNHKDTQAKSTSHAMNHREICREIAINASVKSQGSESAPCGLPATSSLKEFPQHQTVKREIQLGSSPVHPISVSPSSPSPPETTKAPVLEMPTPLSIPPSSSSSTSLVTSEEYIKTSTNVEVPSTSSYSSSSHSTSPFSFSFQTGNQQFNPSLSSTTINTSSQVPSTDIKTTTPPMEPKPSSSEPSLKSDVNAARTSPLQSEPPTAAPTSTAFSSTTIVTDTKNETSDVAATQEDEMEEEASDTTTDLNLGSLCGFNLGSAPPSAAPKSNPFGGAFHNTAVNSASSSFNFSVPSGELFRPASFSIQPIQPSQSASQSAFSRPFTAPEPTQSGFGQPAQIGSGQAALGAVLGGFGQSRQLGTTPPGTGFTSTTGFGGGFATPVPGGFANATSGGFAGVSGTGGGFSGGFTAAAPAGGGFAAAGSGGGGGFAGAGSGGSGGFGSFGNQQGGTGFSSFGGGSAGSGNLNPLFTQMRK